MAYTVKSATPVLGGALMRIEYTQNGGPLRRAFFAVRDLRRRTEGMPFDDVFPLWLRAKAEAAAVDLKTATLAQFRSFVVDQTITAEPSVDAALAKDGV